MPFKRKVKLSMPSPHRLLRALLAPGCLWGRQIFDNPRKLPAADPRLPNQFSRQKALSLTMALANIGDMAIIITGSSSMSLFTRIEWLGAILCSLLLRLNIYHILCTILTGSGGYESPDRADSCSSIYSTLIFKLPLLLRGLVISYQTRFT